MINNMQYDTNTFFPDIDKDGKVVNTKKFQLDYVTSC